MHTAPLHSWELSPAEAIVLQRRLSAHVVMRRTFGRIRAIAGADIAVDVSRRRASAAAIVFSYPDLVEIERATASAELKFPYVPGLLTFREGPALLAAFAKLKDAPDAIMFDGQGVAHPRGFGLASHMGLWLGIPSIGCAKSRLIGRHDMPGNRVGDWEPLIDETSGKVLGAVLRTRSNVKPVFVSIGHMIDLRSAIDITIGCLDRTRIPKPTREADRLVRNHR